MNPELLVIGDISIDIYMHLTDDGVIYKPDAQGAQLSFIHGSKVPVSLVNKNLAGNACHVSIGAARLGIKTAVYTELGDDEDGHSFTKLFKNEGVDNSLCRFTEGNSTNVHTVMWYNDDRTILSYHAKQKYGMDTTALKQTGFVYYTSMAHGFEPFQDELLTAKKQFGFILAFNPGTQHFLAEQETLLQAVKHTDILFVNKQEALKITQCDYKTEYETLHKKLMQLGAKVSVITDGKEGASAYDGRNYKHIQPTDTSIKVVDKTGAGDAFAAAFLSATIQGKDLDTALKWGSKNSEATLAYYGGIKGLLHRKQIDNI